MWFNPLKGAHLTLGQLDKCAPAVGTGVEKIERGSFVMLTADGNFTPFADTAKVPYISLVDYKDYQAGMAGTIGQNANNDDAGVYGTAAFKYGGRDNAAFVANAPRITAIAVTQPAEYELEITDDNATGLDDIKVGDALYLTAAGKLAKTGGACIGFVTAAKHARYVNNKGASVEGRRISGGSANVIAFTTAWAPAASAGSSAVSAPKVVAASTTASKDTATK